LDEFALVSVDGDCSGRLRRGSAPDVGQIRRYWRRCPIRNIYDSNQNL